MPETPPRVRIVTPAGDEAALARTARSLMAQTWASFEWVIVGRGAALGTIPADARIQLRETMPAADAPLTIDLEAGETLAATALEALLWTLLSRSAPAPPPVARRIGAPEVPVAETIAPLRLTLGRTGLGSSPHAWQRAPDGTWTYPAPTSAPVDDATVLGEVQIRDDLPFDHLPTGTARGVLLLVPVVALGGADKFNLDLVRQLRARGVGVTVVVTDDGSLAWLPELLAATPDVFLLARMLPLADAPRFLRHLVVSRGLEAVIVTHSELGYLLLPYLRARFPTLALLDYCHIEDPLWKGGAYLRLATLYDDVLDGHVVSSADLGERLRARGVDGSRMTVCYTGIEVGSAVPRSETDVPTILFAARLHPQKQPAVLAATLAALRARGLAFRAVVAGDGDEEPWLREQLHAAGLDGVVTLVGGVSNARVRELMTSADIFFLPSLTEGISLALYEAMAAGCCVVSADVGGQRELVTPECGVLIEPGTPDEEVLRYTEALAALVADPVHRRRLGDAARARVAEHFGLDAMGAQMIAIVDDAVAHAHRSPRPAPSPALAPALAEQAATAMWGARMAHCLDPYRAPGRTLAYFTLRRWLAPAWQELERRGGTRFARWRRAVRARLTRN